METISKLRPYQQKTVDRLNSLYKQDNSNALIFMPTGTGKTEVAIEFFRQNPDGGLFIMHRKNLTIQTYRRFWQALGFRYGVGLVCANLTHSMGDKKAVVCSVDTLKRRDWLFESLLKKTKYCFIDEAHDATSPGYRKILEKMKNHFVIGMTATPYKINGRYHSFWESQNIINPITIPEAVKQGYLCNMKFFVPKAKLNTAVMKVRGGDYTTESLFAGSDTADVYGDFEKYFKEHGVGRNTITFCVNIAHSKKITAIIEKLNEKNIFRVDHHLSHNEQEIIRNKIKVLSMKGESFHIINVNMFSTGIDIPSLQAGFFLRKTKSKVLWDQQIGRLTRIHESKKEGAVAFDFTENTLEHGTPYTHKREPDLFGKDKRDLPYEPYKICPRCFVQVLRKLPKCPHCGLVFQLIKGPEAVVTENKEVELVDYDFLLKQQQEASLRIDLAGFSQV